MRTHWIIGLGIVAILSSCSTEELDKLKAEKAALEETMAQKDLAVYDLTEGLVAIQGNIRDIAIRENLLNNTVMDDAELAKSPKEQIIKDINRVNELINLNRKQIDALEGKLKKSNVKGYEFEKIVANLKLDLLEKEKVINGLKQSLVNMEASYAKLFDEYQEQVLISGMQDQSLHKVYFAYGSKKELEEMNVIEKSGGILGLGKTYILKPDFNKSYFTEMDDRELHKIPLGVEKVKMVTAHPESSYEMVMEGKVFKELMITDPNSFWAGSKYLALLVE
jgi:hypothetical protein